MEIGRHPALSLENGFATMLSPKSPQINDQYTLEEVLSNGTVPPSAISRPTFNNSYTTKNRKLKQV